jgi:F-type H+-transporting ATPase subunit gamma
VWYWQSKCRLWWFNFDNVAVIADALMENSYLEIMIKLNWFTINLKCRNSNCSNGAILTIGSSTIRFDNFGWLYFEPSKEIIMTLIPKSLKTQLYKAIRDSASEHGARMTAMHKATDNATDLRNELKLTYIKPAKLR